MKKVLVITTALILHSSFFALHLNAQDVKNEEEFKDVNTDQEILDDRKPIFEKPADDSNKDLKYWAEEVGSRLKVTGYAQGGYSATIDEGSANRNTFDVKRVILMVGVDIAPKFYAFFMHDFKSGSMQEYYMEYRHSKAFNVRLGQSKREFTVENPLSPTILESIAPMTQGVVWLNGSDPLQSNGSGRDAGLMIYGKVGKFGYFAELLNGAPINTADRNNQKDVVLKLEYYPVPNFKLSISGVKGYGHAENASPYNESVKKGDNYRKNRYAGGFDWKLKKTGTDYNANRCVTIRSEVMGGKDGQVCSFGAYASSSIPVYKRLDVVGILDYFNYNTDRGLKKTALTGGMQYWMAKKCRLQVQYTYNFCSKSMQDVEKLSGNYSQILAQVQVAF